MGRRMQVFLAPGDEGRALGIPASPWHRGRRVRIPRENWELIVDFAAPMDDAAGELLRRVSRAPVPATADAVRATPDELRALHDFLGTAASALVAAPPLVPAPTADVPDAYSNEEHARMVVAARAAVHAAMGSGEPLRAWIE